MKRMFWKRHKENHRQNFAPCPLTEYPENVRTSVELTNGLNQEWTHTG